VTAREGTLIAGHDDRGAVVRLGRVCEPVAGELGRGWKFDGGGVDGGRAAAEGQVCI
jgi:hypothetical protein